MTKTNYVNYRDAKAVSIENELYQAIFTIKGSKMVSLVDKHTGRELLLQPNNEKLLQGTYDSDYNAVDVSGFDEMLPTIDEYYYSQPPWEGIKLPDHGEVWSIDWHVTLNPDCLEMSVFGVRLPYRFSKRVYFNDDMALQIRYSLENLSPFDMEYVWAAHAIFIMEEDSLILLPSGSKSGTLTESYQNLNGKYGDHILLHKTYHMPHENAISINLSSPQYMDKFYIDDPLTQGQCGVYYPSDNSSYVINFPQKAVPYLGILLSKGLHLGCSCILEPCTAAFDRPDMAKMRKKDSVLKANDTHSWHLSFTKNTIK